MFVEFTLAVKEAKSDRKLEGYELPHCGSKDLEVWYISWSQVSQRG